MDERSLTEREAAMTTADEGDAPFAGVPDLPKEGHDGDKHNRDTDLLTDITARAEAEGIQTIYPEFDPQAALDDPVLGRILRGEEELTLRGLYEAVHFDRIVQGRVESLVQARIDRAVSEAVTEAVATAVRESEERLLGHIRARGHRPAENGTSGASGIRMHPAVDRLTRRERAMLARRAENGENIRL